MLEVYVPIPKPLGSWGGSCGRWYGVAVYCYDTSRVRPHGSNEPLSKNYKYYPAKGALVIGRFYTDDKLFDKTVMCTIPINQPVGEDIAWCYVGTNIPCLNKRIYYVNIDITVKWKDYTWHQSYPHALKIWGNYVNPGNPSENPTLVQVACKNVRVENGMICGDFWLKYCASQSFDVRIGHYVNNRLIHDKLVVLYRDKTVKVCFPAVPGKNCIALRKPGTNVVDNSWVDRDTWWIRS